MNFAAPTYLRHGSERQRAAYEELITLGLLERLAPWRPVLCGTIPIGVDLPGSDLDLICEVYEPEPFATALQAAFGHRPGFVLRRKEKQGLPTVIANFDGDRFPVEIFGQPRPVAEQNAYRHMVVEARLLQQGGPEAVAAIRRLKEQGLKTEPAFAAYFGLAGDPYEALLELFSEPSA